MPAGVLIVEGWITPVVLDQAADEFRTGHYRQALVVRTEYDARTQQLEPGRSRADYVANFLVDFGVPRDSVQTVMCPLNRKDRTFHAALAARQWLVEHNLSAAAVDVATLGPHARRSRLVYERVFGKGAHVGVIALRDVTYDPGHWWRSSEGVRELVGEAIAYLYTRFFFHPSADN